MADSIDNLASPLLNYAGGLVAAPFGLYDTAYGAGSYASGYGWQPPPASDSAVNWYQDMTGIRPQSEADQLAWDIGQGAGLGKMFGVSNQGAYQLMNNLERAITAPDVSLPSDIAGSLPYGVSSTPVSDQLPYLYQLEGSDPSNPYLQLNNPDGSSGLVNRSSFPDLSSMGGGGYQVMPQDSGYAGPTSWNWGAPPANVSGLTGPSGGYNTGMMGPLAWSGPAENTYTGPNGYTGPGSYNTGAGYGLIANAPQTQYADVPYNWSGGSGLGWGGSNYVSGDIGGWS